MAASKSKRRSRKRRNASAAPRAVASQRREQRAERAATAARDERRATRQLGTEGERPPSPFGGLPVSEIAIFAGGAGAVIGVLQGGGPALVVGLIVCTLGVLEVTAREHFSGFRSHASLLSAIPAAAAGVVWVAIFGAPRQRILILVVVVPVYSALFFVLRRRFLAARQARVARPPAPGAPS